MIHIETQPDKYVISFNYNAEIVDFCKNLQQARYNPHQRVWSAARNVPNALDLYKAGFFHDADILLSLSTTSQSMQRGNHQWNINATLYDHQKAFQEWAASRSKILLCAEMGCGKTIMSMLWLQAHQIDPESVLVVCPSSLINNWARELEKFAQLKSTPVLGSSTQRQKLLSEKGLHIINYEYMVKSEKLRDDIARLSKSVIILDESHKVKDPTTTRSKVLHNYCKDKSHALLLTGTPVSQGAQDYYSQFRCIEPRLLGSSFTAFKARYCQLQEVRGAPAGVKRIVGYQNLEELTSIIKPYTHTILKKDCLDLPEKQYVTHFVELSGEQKRFYNQLKRDLVAWLNREEEGEPITTANVLTRYLRLSQVTQGFVPMPDGKMHHFEEQPKLSLLLEIIESLPASESIVIVCRFKSDIQILSSRLDALVIDGDVPIMDRQSVVDAFQSKKCRILIGQIQTMGVGFNMTAANTMIFYSNSYSLTDRLQAEDRIHRIGTTKQCTYIDIVASNTVDEHVVKALTTKQDVANYLTTLRLTN